MSEEVKRHKYESSGDDAGDYIRYSEYERVHSLLVKACVRIANYRAGSLSGVMVTKRIERIKKIYGINLRYTGAGFEEDTTK